MKLFAALFALCSFTNFANADEHRIGNCTLIMPGHSDKAGKHCADPTRVGVAYNGYFASDTSCHSDVSTALYMMKQNSACTMSDKAGHCAILYPGHQDAGGWRCENDSRFGIVYNGYFLNKQACYFEAEIAVLTMKSEQACQ